MSILYEERLQLIRSQPMKPRHNLLQFSLRPEKIGLLEWLGCRSSLSSCFENVLISKNSVSSSINDVNVKVLVIHLSLIVCTGTQLLRKLLDLEELRGVGVGPQKESGFKPCPG